MKITKQRIKTSVIKACIYCSFVLGLIVLIDVFNIQYTPPNRIVYYVILSIVWIWCSYKFDVPDYKLVYEESLKIWRSERK